MNDLSRAVKRVLVTEWMDPSVLADLGLRYEVVYRPQLGTDPAALLAAVPAVDALIVRNLTQVNRALIAAAPRLKVVGRLGVGLDNIDLAACQARGIAVRPATGANARAVAEYVVTAALMMLRGAYFHTGDVMSGTWPRARLAEGREAQGQVLGIVGFGSIGQCVAELALALGFQIRYVGVPPQGVPAALNLPACRPADSLDALLPLADVLSLHVPLTDVTRHLLGEPQLARMKRGAVLINTARGGVIDEAATARALRAGHLGGAAIDVFGQEPLGADNPWSGCPNLVLTPHIAGLTQQSSLRVSQAVAAAVTEVLDSL